jgi:hypothetical protein
MHDSRARSRERRRERGRGESERERARARARERERERGGGGRERERARAHAREGEREAQTALSELESVVVRVDDVIRPELDNVVLVHGREKHFDNVVVEKSLEIISDVMHNTTLVQYR